MAKKSTKEKYVGFLRGINVGGHHKVPMADLRKELEQLGFENVITILNSGNFIFDAKKGTKEKLEKKITTHIEKHFGFPIPTIIRKAKMIQGVLEADPFQGFELTKEIRFYISFLKSDVKVDLKFPWASEDESFRMIDKNNSHVISLLDLSKAKTPKAMEVLEKQFGKPNITTRNWKTILRIEKKL